MGRHGLGTSVRPSCAAPSGLVWLPYGGHCSGDANQTSPRRAPPRARHLVHKVAAGATVRETAEVGVRRRRVAARRLTTITRHLSMLPPAPRVVGSWRQSPGTLRADADHRGWSWRQCGGGPSSGRCECLHDCSMGGVRRVGTLMKPANHRSTEMHSSLRILPSGDPWATSWFLSLKKNQSIALLSRAASTQSRRV